MEGRGEKEEGKVLQYKGHLLLLPEEDDGITDAAHEEHHRLEDPELPLLHPFHLRKKQVQVQV